MSVVDSMYDTVVARLTPPGTAAIAVLAVHGPKAWSTISSLFRAYTSASCASERGTRVPRVDSQSNPAALLGGLSSPARENQVLIGRLGRDLADEVVVVLKTIGPKGERGALAPCALLPQGANAPRLPDPLPLVEIHTHGGEAVVRMVIDLLRDEGITECDWDQIVRRSSCSALQAEAALALTRALTVRTAAILLDQYQGAFAAAVKAVVASTDASKFRSNLGDLLRWTDLGRHLTKPWRVVIAGPPNVGKSSLVNALAGFPRSVVAATAGTTRDVVTTLLAFDGWPVEIADTAGQRDTAAGVESQGVELARAAAGEADLCLWVLDASDTPCWPEVTTNRVRFVINKSDLPAAWNLDRAEGALKVSALTGAGVPELCTALGRWLVPEVPPAGMALPFTAELCDLIEAAWLFSERGLIDEARTLLADL